MKIIHIEGSRYKIEYEPNQEWNFKILRGNEDVTRELKTNITSDIIGWLIENLEDNKELKGFRLE